MTVIKTSDFFDDGYKKDLQEIANEWRKLGEDVKLVIGQLKGAGKGLRKSLEETSTSTSGGQDQIKKMAKEIQQLEKAIEQLRIAQTLYGKETVYVREQTRQKTAANKAEAQALLSTAGSYNRLSAELKEALILIKEIDVSTTKGKEAFKKSAKEIHRMRASLKDMDAQMNNHARNVGNYQSGLKGLMGTVKRLAAVYLGFEAFRSAVRTTRDLTVQTDSLRLAYSKIIPDSGKLAKTNAFLSKTAENYGIDLNSLRKNYLRFTAASKSSNLTMQETQAIFNSVAKAGSVMGLEAIRMDRAFNALEQMLSKGKVSSEELRQQLGDSLPGSMEIMADALDVTTLKLSEMLEQGEILSDEALKKFAKQLEITYGIENLTRVENLAASQGRLKTAVIELVDAMETTGTFRDFYTAMADGVKFIARNVDAIKNLIKAITALGVAYAGLNFGAFISSISLTRIGMLRLIVTIKQAVVATKAWNLALRLNPLGALITAITTAIGLFVLFNKETTESKVILGKLTEMQSELNEEIQEAIKKNSELEESKRKSVEAIKDEVTQKKVLNWEEEYGLELKREQIKLEAFYQQLKEGFYGDKFDQTIILNQIEQSRKRVRFLKEQLNFAKLLTPAINKAISATMRLFAPGAKPFITVTPKVTDDGGGDKEEDEFGARERSVNAMREGLLKELALLKLKHDKEDAELEKHGDDVTKNDAKHFDERLALLYSYYSEAEDARMKAIDEENKEREALMKESIDDAKKLLSEQEALNKSSISLAKSQGMGGADLKLYENALDIQYLEKKLDLSKQLNLNSYEEYEIETKLLELRKNAQALFLKTDVGQKAMSAVFGFNFGKPDKKKEGLSELNIFGFDANKLLGLEDDELALVVEGFGIAKNAMADYYRTAIELSNQLVQQRNQEVASAERALDREIASRNAGYANFVDDAQRRLNVAKKAQEEALERRQELQRQQLIADSVIQASSLVTAAAGILKSSINPLIAIPLISLMFGTFLGAKAKALQLTRQEFAEGDLSIIGGGRHGSGNDTLVGFSGGRAQFAEQGEARMILSRRVTAKYKDVLPDLFESLNRGTFDIDALKGTNSPIPSLVVNARTDTSRMEKELVAIRRQGETQTIYDNGKKVVIKGNRIKRYV